MSFIEGIKKIMSPKSPNELNEITRELPKLIPVGKNDWALVDAEDYETLLKRSWYLSAGNYAVTNSLKADGPPKTIYYMHRLIVSPPNGFVTDHRNESKLDNRRLNLRVCKQHQNIRNKGKGKKIEYSSRFKGVWYRKDRDRWAAYIDCNGERTNLGCYATEEEAAQVFNKAAKELHGEFARLNEI